VMVSIYLIHNNETLFPQAHRFDPDRFLDKRPDTYEWIPFGGGVRRCIGAAFANTELNVVLRTLLRDFTLEPTTDPDERWHSRGIASCPAKGGRAVVHRRSPPGSIARLTSPERVNHVIDPGAEAEAEGQPVGRSGDGQES
jgi:cytochrome P450 family 138